MSVLDKKSHTQTPCWTARLPCKPVVQHSAVPDHRGRKAKYIFRRKWSNQEVPSQFNKQTAICRLKNTARQKRFNGLWRKYGLITLTGLILASFLENLTWNHRPKNVGLLHLRVFNYGMGAISAEQMPTIIVNSVAELL